MKKLIPAAAALCLMASCANTHNAADDVAAPTDSLLIKRLQALQQERLIAVGHHDDPAYGHYWEYVADSSDVKNVTGDYPAIFDWDLGGIELQHTVQLDSVPLAFIKEQAIKHAAEGGINSFSWHLRNPKTGGDAWDTSDSAVVRSILTEPALNDTMRVWIGRVADYIGELRDSTGTRIPVILRPWHEHTGSWFWWGEKLCTADEYKALWGLTREVFDQKGIDNVVWAYSPGTEPQTEEEYLERYPGDELIDILGVDSYYFGDDSNRQNFKDALSAALTLCTTVADKHGKVAALTETGMESTPITDWFTGILYPVIKEYPIAYVVFWRNSQKNPKHHYTPYAGHPTAPDFAKFHDEPQTAFLKEMQNVK